MMMDRFRVVLRRINPRLEYFKDKKIVCSYETRIADLALEIGKTLGDERWRHTLGWHSGQVERCKLVDFTSRRIADFHHRRCQFERREGDYTLAGRVQRRKCVIGIADYTSDQCSNSTIMCQDIVITLARSR